jgi:hypothetical protein
VQEIRGPGHPLPDSVPDEFVAAYGAQARHTVRYRRSWRYRLARRVGRLVQGYDAWYLVAAGLLWTLIIAATSASIVLAVMRWPAQTAFAGILVATALISSLVTAVWYRRREPI